MSDPAGESLDGLNGRCCFIFLSLFSRSSTELHDQNCSADASAEDVAATQNKGFHDAVEKLVGDAVAEALLANGRADGRLTGDAAKDRLSVEPG